MKDSLILYLIYPTCNVSYIYVYVYTVFK